MSMSALTARRYTGITKLLLFEFWYNICLLHSSALFCMQFRTDAKLTHFLHNLCLHSVTHTMTLVAMNQLLHDTKSINVQIVISHLLPSVRCIMTASDQVLSGKCGVSQ